MEQKTPNNFYAWCGITKSTKANKAGIKIVKASKRDNRESKLW